MEKKKNKKGRVALIVILNLAAMTGFGADGNKEDKEHDFSEVRGDFESNSFVTAVLEHIKVKEALGNELIARLG